MDKNEMLNDFLFNLFTQDTNAFNFDPFKPEKDQKPMSNILMQDESMRTVFRANSMADKTGQKFDTQEKFQTSSRRVVSFSDQRDDVHDYDQQDQGDPSDQQLI